MVGTCASGNHQREIPGVITLFDRDFTHGGSHIHVDDIVHAGGGLVKVHSQRFCDVFLDRLLCLLQI